MKRISVVGYLLLVCMVISLAPVANAQNITASIGGTVTDAKGGAVAGATVTITNTDQNVVVKTVKTDDHGDYMVPLLIVGHYSVSAEMTGFKKATKTSIMLNVNDKLSIDLTLEVGSVTEVVTVEASPLQVETQSATPAGLITGTQVRELALNTRNYEALVALMPGVSAGSLDQLYVGNSLPSGLAAVVSMSVNGQRNSANNWTVDGIDNVDRGSNLTLSTFPSIDSISEFKVLRSLYDAEFGRAGGGQINVVTKSGTSEFHGSAYEFFRNDVLAANNFFNNKAKLNRPPLRYNDFGYTIGGPVWKNHTFFFFSEEFRRVIQYSTFSAVEPTPAMLTGTFADPVCTVYNASGSACTTSSTTVSSINPAAAAYIKDIWSKFPAPNSGTFTLNTAQRSTFNYREELARVDHTFNSKLSVYGRYLHDSIPTFEPGGLFTGASLPGVANTSTNSPGYSWTGHYTYTIKANWLNDGGYGFNYSAIISNPVGLDTRALSPDVVSAITLPFAVSLIRIPDLSISGFSTVTSFGQYRDYNRDHNAFDNLTWIKGSHTIRLGVSYHHYNKHENAGGNNTGGFSFVNTPPPDASTGGAGACAGANCQTEQNWANFLQGNVSTFSQVANDIDANIIEHQWEAYGQDEFRVRSNLTLTLGLRWSYFGQPTDAFGNLANFDPALYNPAHAPTIIEGVTKSSTKTTTSGGVTTTVTTVSPDFTVNGLMCLPSNSPCPGGFVPNPNYDPLNGFIVGGKNSPFGTHIGNNNYRNFAPRVGLAWDPFNDGKTSVRAGYGMFFDSIAIGNYENAIYNDPPVVKSVQINNTQFTNPGAVSAVVSASPTGGWYAMPIPFHTPYTQQWSLDVQHQFKKDWMIDVGYYGNNAHHLTGLLDLNQPAVGAGVAAGYLNVTTTTTVTPPGTTTTTTTTPTTIFSGAATPSLNGVRPFIGYTFIRGLESAFNSNYHSLQAQLQKRWGQNSLFVLNYTWSHNLTNNPSDRSNPPQVTSNINAEYGPANLDRRYGVTANYVYSLPWYKSQEGLAGHLLGGWEASGVIYYYSGAPLTVTDGSRDTGGIGCALSFVSCRPDITGNPNNGGGVVPAFFVTSAFSRVPDGTVRVGNSGRNVVVGPRFQKWDLALFKNTNIVGERVYTQFRLEAINAFNHTNLNAVTTSITSATFGQSTTAHDARIVQLALKLYF